MRSYVLTNATRAQVRWQVWRSSDHRGWLVWDGADCFNCWRFPDWRTAYAYADRMARRP